MQLAGDHQPIAPVVAAAADYHKALACDAKFLQNGVIGGFAGVFHQNDAGDGVFFNRGAVELVHFGYAGDFHGFTSSLATATSFYSPASFRMR